MIIAVMIDAILAIAILFQWLEISVSEINVDEFNSFTIKNQK